jgi:hypothetical protein
MPQHAFVGLAHNSLGVAAVAGWHPAMVPQLQSICEQRWVLQGLPLLSCSCRCRLGLGSLVAAAVYGSTCGPSARHTCAQGVH